MKKLVLGILFFIVLVGSVSALPVIDFVEGNLSDGENITINGNSFGVSGPNIIIFDDFEKGVENEAIQIGPNSAQIGNWVSMGGSNSQKYSSEAKNSGNFAFKSQVGTTCENYPACGSYCGSNYLRTNFSDTREWFGSYWVYQPAGQLCVGYNRTPSLCANNPANCCNWKLTWVHAGNNGHNLADTDFVWASLLYGDYGEIIFSNALNTIGVLATIKEWKSATLGAYAMGNWERFDMYIKAEPTPTGKSIGAKLYRNGVETYKPLFNISDVLLLADESHYFRIFDLGAWVALTNGGCSEMYFDDAYFATDENCMARVEIGNNPAYYNCTNLAIVPPTSWSDNSITATVRQGNFQPGEEVYLFVVDANNNPSEGYGPINLSGEIVPPEYNETCGNSYCNATAGENCTTCSQDCGNCTITYATPHIQDYITLQEMIGSIEDYKRGLTPIEQVVENIKKFIWG